MVNTIKMIRILLNCVLSGPQKHITKESDGFHNHSTQLTMVSSRDCRKDVRTSDLVEACAFTIKAINVPAFYFISRWCRPSAKRKEKKKTKNISDNWRCAKSHYDYFNPYLYGKRRLKDIFVLCDSIKSRKYFFFPKIYGQWRFTINAMNHSLHPLLFH